MWILDGVTLRENNVPRDPVVFHFRFDTYSVGARTGPRRSPRSPSVTLFYPRCNSAGLFLLEYPMKPDEWILLAIFWDESFPLEK